MFDFFTHLHSKVHRKTLDPYERPWASSVTKIRHQMPPSEEKLTKPAKGSEFLLPVRGFFCLLCKEFYGDAICAEEHVTTHAHNESYKKQMYENPLYEQRRNLDRQAGLSMDTSGKKRKMEDEDKGDKDKEKDKEDKPKHKKEKKDKERKKDHDNGEEEKPKIEKAEPTRKDEDDKYKYSKKDDKYRHREEEEKSKYGRRDEEDRYKHGKEDDYRFRSRRDDDDRPKYITRDDYKPVKYPDTRFKNDKDRGPDKEALKRSEQGKAAPAKPEVKKQPEPPPKPYEPPKIMCGPSPAMRAKLRKQSMEAGKPGLPAAAAATAATATPAASASATAPMFGKFTWKKRENTLAKEAQKVAAEFIKEDEAAARERQATDDSFAKSMAYAKEIAEKLAGQSNMPPPWAANGANRGRIRPNLPAPPTVFRKTAAMGKPAPLNTFLTMKPPTPESPAFPVQNSQPQAKPVPSVPAPVPPPDSKAQQSKYRPQSPIFGPALPDPKPAAPETKPVPFKTPFVPPLSKADTSWVKPDPPAPRPAPVEAKPAVYGPQLPASRPAPFETKPVAYGPQLPTPTPVTSQAKPPTSEAKPATSGLLSPPLKSTLPQAATVEIVSDVAAPGVPESEYTQTVFIKPPPLNMTQRSDKLKSNLAAAKAKDLFDIFYSSSRQSGPSSLKPAMIDTRSDRASSTPSPAQPQTPPLLPPQPVAKPQPQPLPQPQPVPQPIFKPQPQPEPQPSPKPLTLPQLEPQPSPKPMTLPQLEPQPCPKPMTLPHQEPQPSPKPMTLPQLEPQLSPKPLTQPQLEPQPSPKPLAQPQLEPQLNTQQPSKPSIPQLPATVLPTLQPEPNSPPANTQADSNFGIQIESVWSLHTAGAPPSEKPQPTMAPLEPSVPEHVQSLPEAPPEILKTPEPESSPNCRTRGKSGARRTPPAAAAAARPTRQTRSQTRYQTRSQQLQQSQPEPEPEPEPEPASGESDSADQGSGSHSEDGAVSQEEQQQPRMPELTPETLGLPLDMTALDFEYDFNFE